MYLVKKLSANYANSNHRFGKLRSKHYLLGAYTVHLLKQPSYTLYTCSIDQTWM